MTPQHAQNRQPSSTRETQSRTPAQNQGPAVSPAGAAVLRMQATAGNQAVAQMVAANAPAPAAAPVAAPPPVHRSTGSLWDDAFESLASAARERLLGPLTAMARKAPSYDLLALALGRDPISGHAVEQSAGAIVGAVAALVPGGTELIARLRESGAIQRAGAWLSAEVPKLGLSWEAISGLFGRALDSLSSADMLDPTAAWARVAGIFAAPVARLTAFAAGAVEKLQEIAFESALALGGGMGDQIMAVLRRGGAVLGSVFRDPIGFAGNLMSAVRGGLGAFMGNIGKHLQTGVLGWLTGALRGVIELPQRFDLRGIVSVVLQLLGLTWTRLRERLVGRLGAPRVAFLERSVDFVQRIATEGLPAVWEKILEFASGLTDTVFGAIREWITNNIVTAAITRIVTMFNPAGALIQAIMSIYRGVQWLIERAQQLQALASSVFDSIEAIASGRISGAVAAVEGALARTLPVVISFLASQLGLGDGGEHVRKVVDRVRGVVDGAISRVGEWIVRRFSRTRNRGAEGAEGARDTDRVKREALAEARRVLRARKPESVEQARALLSEVHARFRPAGLRQLALHVPDSDAMRLSLEATASPKMEEEITWAEVFAQEGDTPLPELEPLYARQGQETHAALSVGGRLVADKSNEGGQHAEEQLLASGAWEKALVLANKLAGASNGERVTVALVINRSPCHSICTPMLAEALERAKLRRTGRGDAPALPHLGHVDFVLAPTGTYEPARKLSSEEQQAYRQELVRARLPLNLLKKALVKEEFRKALPGETRVADVTRGVDLVRLAKAGWDLRLLRVSEGKKLSSNAREWLMAVQLLKQRFAQGFNATAVSR